MTITPASAATPDNAVPSAANAHPVAPAANAHSVAPAASATPASPDVRKARQLTRSDFDFFEGITLRYADNDANGHVNNAYYYSFFDTSVDAFLMATGYRSALRGEYQTLVVASECRYFSQVSSPGRIEVGVRIGRVGNSTVQYAAFSGPMRPTRVRYAVKPITEPGITRYHSAPIYRALQSISKGIPRTAQ